jgi:uncharacterized protein YllA (UPF0747 family)
LKSLFEAAYLKHDNLADATPISEFTFGTYGLVILDADDADLKRPFIPFAKKELLHQTSHKAVLETTEKLKSTTYR